MGEKILTDFDTVEVLVEITPNVTWRVALLGGTALLEEVCHSHFLLPVDLDGELSALSPALCLTVSTMFSSFMKDYQQSANPVVVIFCKQAHLIAGRC